MSRASCVRGRLLALLSICGALAMCVPLVLSRPVLASSQASPQPIDLMLIIDNSCSMYEPGNETCGKNALGSDPGFLRVTGASLFAARMAFGQPQAADRIGAISMGTHPAVLYSLAPIEESRKALAVAVDQPGPLGGTQVMEALNLAYQELDLRSGPGRKPVVVFLTDGVPDPIEGQSFADIERVVKGHEQVPLYVLLLQNQSDRVPQDVVVQYRAYIDEWKKLEQRATNIQVYVVPSDEDLLLIYNHVMADLAGGPGSLPPVTLKAGETKEFYVSRFAKRIYITAIHPDREHRGRIEILDKSGQPVVVGEPGVEVFVDSDNPVEVYSAFGPRLTGQTAGTWKVTSIDATLSFFVDQTGAYAFDWLSPTTEAGSLPGVLIATSSVNPAATIDLQFRLVDDEGAAILEKQNVSGQVTAPNGEESDLKALNGLGPDAQGVYSLAIRLADFGPADSKGRFEISMRSDDPEQTGPEQAIAVVRLWIEADPDVATPAPTPTSTPSPTRTPTLTATPTPTLFPRPTVPPPSPTPCPNPPLCKSTGELALWGLLVVLAVMGGTYGLLRMVRRPPEGFVVVVQDSEPQPPKPIRGLASRKVFRWWELTVGPGGNVRIRPSVGAAEGVGGMGPPDGAGGQVKVNIPGVGESVVATGGGQVSGGKKASKAKKSKVLGRFVNDGGKTRFINLYSRGTTTLTGDTVQTVSFGNIQLRMCLDRTKLV